MKTATIPSVRVEPELREQVERVLTEGESLSEFVEASVRDSVMRRLTQAEFVKRGLTSLEEARQTGVYVSAEVVLDRLEAKLAKARSDKAAKPRKAASKR